jgi:hypothetical protein
MSEEQAVLTAPETGSAGAETPSTVTEPSTQVDDQQSSVQTGKVEPVSQTSSNRGHSKPSFFSSTREKLSKLEYELKAANERNARIEQLLSKYQNPTAPAAPEQFVFNSDDDIYREGLTNSLKKFEQYMMEKAEKRFQEGFGKYQESYQESLKQKEIQEKQQAAEQEVQERIDKFRENGLDVKVAEILKKYPALNNASIGDPLKAKEILDFIESEYLKDVNKTPLAPKKSRMGMIGSGSPVGGSQGKPSLEQIKAVKTKLEEELPTRGNDPEFKKQ